MKALFSSRKPRSGSSTCLPTPLLEAAQIICKWQPRGSGEDVVIVAIIATAIMIGLEMIMLAVDRCQQ